MSDVLELTGTNNVATVTFDADPTQKTMTNITGVKIGEYEVDSNIIASFNANLRSDSQVIIPSEPPKLIPKEKLDNIYNEKLKVITDDEKKTQFQALFESLTKNLSETTPEDDVNVIIAQLESFQGGRRRRRSAKRGKSKRKKSAKKRK